jgi:predicted DNA-binding transcriptional regulator YafY
VRADRLISLVLLLQARGRVSARDLATELEVSVRTVYRDLTALSTAGVPVVTEPGPHGGCWLLGGYRFPLRGLSPDEAEALLVLGVPRALAELGLGEALSAAYRKISVTSGVRAPEHALVYLDMPRWFHGEDRVPHLRTLAEAIKQRRYLRIGYRRGDHEEGTSRDVGPLGLVNKAGLWYLVATPLANGRKAIVFRASRITSARILSDQFGRPADFSLAAFWEQWSASFAGSRPAIEVRVRASPAALAAFPEIFGDAVQRALDAAPPPDERGWREVTLSFEHETAAAHRLAGFGGDVEVLSSPAVRALLVAAARQILARYRSPTCARNFTT